MANIARRLRYYSWMQQHGSTYHVIYACWPPNVIEPMKMSDSEPLSMSL